MPRRAVTLLAVANVLDRFYRGLFRAAIVAVAGACLWAIWSEWVNPWHDEHVQSTAIAATLLVATALAAWRADDLYELLRRRPAWSVAPAAIATVAIWIDGSQGSELFVVSLLMLGPVAVATGIRWTIAIAAGMTLGYLIGLVAVNDVSWARLEEIDEVDTQLERILAYLPVALLFAYPLEKGASFVARSNQIVEDEQARLESQLRRAKLQARAAKLEPQEPPDDGPRTTDDLSAREVEVCQLVAEGLSNAEIAERLFLSPRTVQSHVANAMSKTGASSRTQLAVMTIRDGLAPLRRT
jgi:DNA-binding CsgD family transcriptional regulator